MNICKHKQNLFTHTTLSTNKDSYQKLLYKYNILIYIFTSLLIIITIKYEVFT